MEYSKFSVKELKGILDQKGVKGYSKYKKDELINILSKLENIEDEETKENEAQETKETSEVEADSIPLPPEPIEEEGSKEEVESSEVPPEVPEEPLEERIKDPVKLFENFKPTLAISGNKKSEILKGMIEYKTAQKLMERQEIQNEINKVLAEVRVMRQEYLSMLDIVKKDLKEVRESFLMANLIILHNFSFLPLDKLPIFKSQKK
jgi:hypothetical protein